MQIMVSTFVSDRSAIDGTTGLHAEIKLRDQMPERSHALEGMTTITDEAEMGQVEITCNELALDEQAASVLLQAAFESSWNDILINHHTGSGIRCRLLVSWLVKHTEVDGLSRLVRHVESALHKR